MANLSIIRMIAMAVVFGLFLTSGDQISDLYIMINTYIFGGNTLGIVACKYCSNPEGSTPMINKSMICQTCTTASARKDGGLQCGVKTIALQKLSKNITTRCCFSSYISF